MEVKIKIPDQVWNEDSSYVQYFDVIQKMVDRMAMSHFKYGPIDINADIAKVDEMKCALQRIAMYDSNFITDAVWYESNPKKLNTGNTENLVDAANFLVIETMFPKHAKAKFKAQTSDQSPGLSYTGE